MASITRHFGLEDVHVTVPFDKYPDEDGVLRDVKIYKKRKKSSNRMKRVVINFYVCYKIGGTRYPITNFAPGTMKLEVGYQEDEVDEDLRYYDVANDEWVKIPHTPVPNGHGQNIGHGVAYLETWPGDPNVGWGGG